MSLCKCVACILDLHIYILYSPVDSTEDPKAESDTALSEDAVFPVWTDICRPWQTFGWWHPSSGHSWHGEVGSAIAGGPRLRKIRFIARRIVLGSTVKLWMIFFCLPTLELTLILFCHFSRLKDVQTLEELGDVYNHFLLYYGRDIPKMQNAAKANKKRIKKIKEVSEDGKLALCELILFVKDCADTLVLSIFYMTFLLCRWRGRIGGRRGRRTERTWLEAGISSGYVQHLSERWTWLASSFVSCIQSQC